VGREVDNATVPLNNLQISPSLAFGHSEGGDEERRKRRKKRGEGDEADIKSNNNPPRTDIQRS